MYINVNGINMYYECIGKGREIILVHGNTNSSSYMKFIARKLAKDYKVYIIDRRCCGKSEKNCALTYEDTAEDIHQFITKLNLQKPVILGSSGGGTVLLYLAIKYSDLVSKIILCSAVSRKSEVKMPRYVEFTRKLKWYPGKKNDDKFFNLINKSKDLTEEMLNKISSQTLVVNGDRDIVSINEAQFISKNIPNSELLILKGETHTSYLIRIKWFDKLKEFIDK